MGRCGGIQEANNAGGIGKLNSLRFEMQSGKRNLSRAESEEISEMEFAVR